MKSKKREDLFVAFAKWSKCTPTRHNNNTDGEGYGQFFTCEGRSESNVCTHESREESGKSRFERRDEGERTIRRRVCTPDCDDDEDVGRQKIHLRCGPSWSVRFYLERMDERSLFGNSTKKKGRRRRKHCQLEVRSIEFNDEEDVVVRSRDHQMKKTTLKNVEGMVFVKGFEVNEKTGTVAVVGAASEDDEGKETTMCVTMYSFRSTSENIGEFPVDASGKGSSSSPFSSAVESNSKKIVSSSRCDVSVESDASAATIR